MPINIRRRSLFNFLKSYLLQLNLFNTGTPDENVIQNERRSTRLYLIFFILSMIILTICYSTISNTQINPIRYPTFTKYSSLIQNPSLVCRCSNISIKYSKFIEIKPHYHEVCQSDFISNKWIDHLFILYQQSQNKSESSDFRRIGLFQFQTIRSLCELAKDTIKNDLQSLNSTDFIQPQLISEEFFHDQINSFIRNFIQVTPKTSMRILQFLQDTTAQSLFMTGASMTSVRPITQWLKNVVGEIVPYPGMNYTFKDNSSCVCSSSTATTCMGPTIFNNDIIPGFQTGCYMFSALMSSTLEAFNNQTFVDILSNAIGKFQKLNSSNPNSKVEKLISEMFVKSWSNSTSYEKYFQNCAPDSCQYTTTERRNFWTILLLLIGLFGGISSALRIIIPILIVNIWPFIWKIILRRYGYNPHTVTVEPIPVRSMTMCIKMFFQLVKQKLLELNWFKSIPPSQDQTILQRQRIQTRIYLILFLIGLSTFTVYLSIKPYTITVTVKSPSLANFTKLYQQNLSALNCPCNQTTIEYDQFITHLKPQYHEICSSEFTTPRWINLHFSVSPIRILFTHDIRYQSQIHFQLLSTLCRMANRTIEENLQLFYQTKLITNQTLDSLSFHTQVNTTIEQFITTVPESYLRTLELIQVNSEINQFIVPINSDFKNEINANGQVFYTLKPSLNEYLKDVNGCYQHSYCHCLFELDDECFRRTMIFRSDEKITIPGMFQKMFPLQSVLMSTLECFYNDTCLFDITRHIDWTLSPTNFSTLNLSLLSFDESHNDTIEKLAKKLFIQSWNNQSSYEKYFNKCHPVICQHSYKSQFNVFYVIITIIGLVGGLDIALSLLIPPIVEYVSHIWKNRNRRKRNNAEANGETSPIKSTFLVRLRALITLIKKKIVELNLFPTNPPSQDEHIIRIGRRATQIYLILLLVSIYIVAVYTSLTQEKVTDIKDSLSKSDYLKLFDQYSLTLQCPCNHTVIKYKKFIDFVPEYHPICSSIFVSSNWSHSMYHAALHYKKDFDDDDFRRYIQKQFQTVSIMCSLSEKILDASVLTWLETNFATASVISSAEFNVQIEKLIKEFKRKIANQFKQTFKLILVTNHANQLATAQSSNWKFVGSITEPLYDVSKIESTYFGTIVEILSQVQTLPRIYGENNCSCALQLNCSKLPNLPYRSSDNFLNGTLPGFLIGCLPFDALLQSTFTCLYNQTCLDIMQRYIYYRKAIPAKILIESALTLRNTSIETYLNELFVTQWLENKSFDQYFTECDPKLCEYSYIIKFNLLYFLTTIIALFGGLTDGLHFVVSCLSKLIIKLYERRKKKQVIPSSQQSNIPSIDGDDTTVEVVLPQSKLTTNHKERAIIVCLCLLMVVSIALVSLFWLNNDKNTDVSRNPTTTIKTTVTVTESTIARTNIYNMTLIYQPAIYSIGDGGKSMVIADFNKDSIQDLAVTNYDDHTISVLLGNENGTFQRQQTYSTGEQSYPWGITTGYFNHDIFLDLAVTLSIPNEIAIFYGVASENLFTTPPDKFSVGGDFLAQKTNGLEGDILTVIDAKDLDNDGFTDLVVGGHYVAGSSGYDRLHIVYHFVKGLRDSRIYVSWHDLIQIDSIAIGDFDNDGRENDISVCTMENRVNQVQTLSSIERLEGETFTAKVVKNIIYERAESIVRGRFNNDKLDDLALVSSQSDTLQILLAYGDGTFVEQIYSTDRYPTSVARINFNNDSIDDLAILTCHQTIRIYLGTNHGVFHQNDILIHIGEINNNKCVHSLRVADFNQDKKDDLAFIDPEAKTIRVLLSTDGTKPN